MESRMKNYVVLYVFDAVDKYLKTVYEVNGFELGDDMNDFTYFLESKSNEELLDIADNCYNWQRPKYEEGRKFIEKVISDSGLFDIVEIDNVIKYLKERDFFCLGDGFIEIPTIIVKFNEDKLFISDRIFISEGDYTLGNKLGDIVDIKYFGIKFTC